MTAHNRAGSSHAGAFLFIKNQLTAIKIMVFFICDLHFYIFNSETERNIKDLSFAGFQTPCISKCV